MSASSAIALKLGREDIPKQAVTLTEADLATEQRSNGVRTEFFGNGGTALSATGRQAPVPATCYLLPATCYLLKQKKELRGYRVAPLLRGEPRLKEGYDRKASSY
jgi:hypothetical protein